MSHIHEKIDFTVEVFVVFENSVLLRKHDKYKVWLSVGGHIELDEDPTEAAIREVKEEVGLDIELWDSRRFPDASDHIYKEILPPVSIGRHKALHPTSDSHEHVTLVYYARALNTNVSVAYEGDRSDEWKWCSQADLASMDLHPNVRAYATQALETLAS